jgi:pilus assembly protein CpaF
VVVHVERLRDGTRKVVQISEIVGMEEEVITMQDIFRFTRTGFDAEGHVIGRFAPSGIRPRLLERLHDLGLEVPREIESIYPDSGR